jgi:hypothetical protein
LQNLDGIGEHVTCVGKGVCVLSTKSQDVFTEEKKSLIYDLIFKEKKKIDLFLVCFDSFNQYSHYALS